MGQNMRIIDLTIVTNPPDFQSGSWLLILALKILRNVPLQSGSLMGDFYYNSIKIINQYNISHATFCLVQNFSLMLISSL